jgi:hypothetical protein
MRSSLSDYADCTDNRVWAKCDPQYSPDSTTSTTTDARLHIISNLEVEQATLQANSEGAAATTDIATNDRFSDA